jgi:dienelactone hydrolase
MLVMEPESVRRDAPAQSMPAGSADRGVPVVVPTRTGGVHAWWHASPDATGLTIIVCPALALEASRDYRVMRRWCARLSSYGHRVLRLSWPGTGFNAELPADASWLNVWEDAIRAAMAWCRTREPSSRFVLAGRRGGALIAAGVTASPDIVGAIWWTPAFRGRVHMRELAVYGRLQRHTDVRVLDDHFSGVEIGGYRLPAPFVNALSSADLIERSGDATIPTLIIASPGEEPTIEQVQALAARASVRVIVDAEARIPMDDWTRAAMPHEATNASVEFLRAVTQQHDARETATITQESSLSAATVGASRVIGAMYDMAAMVVEPAGAPTGTTIVLLGNGTDPVAGAHDMNARLARRWSADGHAVVSVTLPGLGDSLAPAGARENDDYPAFGVDAIRDTVDAARQLTQARRIVLAGICSGGWYALHAAANGVAVDLVLAGNPPLYFDGSPARRDEIETLGFEGRELQAEDGRVHPVRAMLSARQRATAVRYLRRALRVRRLPAGPMCHSWRTTLAALAQGTTPVHIVYGRADVGFRPLVWAGYIPDTIPRLARGPVTIHVAEGTDHQFTGPAEAVLAAHWDAALRALPIGDDASDAR